MKQIGDKYNDLAEDKAQNEIYNANKEIERKLSRKWSNFNSSA